MSDFKRLSRFVCVTSTDESSEESKQWSKYQNPVILQMKGVVNNIVFSPFSHQQFFVAHSSKLEIYSAVNGQRIGSFPRCKETVLSFAIRRSSGVSEQAEGIVGVGASDGFVRLFDTKFKHLLRRITAHHGAVRGVGFAGDKNRLYSCSDDKSVSSLDFSTGSVIDTYEVFNDRVRCLTTCSSQSTFVCGSYDKTLKVFDTRMEDPVVATLNHGYPVDAARLHSGGNILASGGARKCRVWDLRLNGIIKTFEDHHKNIMSLTFNGDESRILTAGLDRMVKVYSSDLLENVHSMKQIAPVMSVSMSQDNKHFIVGMSDASVVLTTLQEKAEEKPQKQIISIEDTNTSARRKKIMNKDVKPPTDEFLVPAKPIKHLEGNPLLKPLRKFKHGTVLAKVLSAYDSPVEDTYAVLLELKRRSKLRFALSSLTLPISKRLFNFLADNIQISSMLELLSEVVMIAVELYAGTPILLNSANTEKLKIIRQKLNNKLQRAELLVDLNSQMQCLIAGANNFYSDYEEPITKRIKCS